MKEQTLSDKGEERIISGVSYREKDVKDFIKETISDIEGGYEGEELLIRIKKRAGEKLIWKNLTSLNSVLSIEEKYST